MRRREFLTTLVFSLAPLRAIADAAIAGTEPLWVLIAPRDPAVRKARALLWGSIITEGKRTDLATWQQLRARFGRLPGSTVAVYIDERRRIQTLDHLSSTRAEASVEVARFLRAATGHTNNDLRIGGLARARLTKGRNAIAGAAWVSASCGGDTAEAEMVDCGMGHIGSSAYFLSFYVKSPPLP